jgi:hypothetical protein
VRPNPLLRVSAALAALAAIGTGADIADQIRTEIQRVRELTAAVQPNPKFKDLRTYLDDSLKAATEELAAGRLYSSMDKLAQAADLAGGMKAAANDADVVKGGLPAFEVEFKKTSVSVTTNEPVSGNMSAAVRALAETARVKTPALLAGGRGFATSTHPQDGLFHLGEAQGQAEFARFCATLGRDPSKQPFAGRSLAAELHALQDKTDAAFVPPRSIEKHSTFIGLNSAIKLARELDAAKSYDGALYHYLDAVLQYGMLDAPLLDAAAKDAVRTALVAERRKIENSKRDDSIAEAFVERAESALSRTPGEDVWNGAAVIAGQVLPAYYTALSTAPVMERPAAKAVEITLVRWPYT